MNIEKVIDKDFHVYKFKGRIDFHPHDILDQSVLKDAIASKAKHVVLDFSTLNYISSLGIRFIFDIKTELTKLNISIAIAGASESIIQVFQLLGLYETFAIFPTLDEAFDHLNKKG